MEDNIYRGHNYTEYFEAARGGDLTRECSQQVGVVKGGGSRCDEAKYCGIQLYDSMSVVRVCVCVFVCVCVCNVW